MTDRYLYFLPISGRCHVMDFRYVFISLTNIIREAIKNDKIVIFKVIFLNQKSAKSFKLLYETGKIVFANDNFFVTLSN